jgi:hypothetical protein
MMNVTEYLKLNELKEVICTYIASQNYFNYNEKKMETMLKQNNVFYSRQMEINLKRDLLGYAKQFSKDVLENYRTKLEKKREALKAIIH